MQAVSGVSATALAGSSLGKATPFPQKPQRHATRKKKMYKWVLPASVQQGPGKVAAEYLIRVSNWPNKRRSSSLALVRAGVDASDPDDGSTGLADGWQVPRKNMVLIGSDHDVYSIACTAAFNNLMPIIFEGTSQGTLRGWQLMVGPNEPYPVFANPWGPERRAWIRAKAVRDGAQLYAEDVVRVDLSQRPFRVLTKDREVLAAGVVIAGNISTERLGISPRAKFVYGGEGRTKWYLEYVYW